MAAKRFEMSPPNTQPSGINVPMPSGTTPDWLPEGSVSNRGDFFASGPAGTMGRTAGVEYGDVPPIQPANATTIPASFYENRQAVMPPTAPAAADPAMAPATPQMSVEDEALRAIGVGSGQRGQAMRFQKAALNSSEYKQYQSALHQKQAERSAMQQAQEYREMNRIRYEAPEQAKIEATRLSVAQRREEDEAKLKALESKQAEIKAYHEASIAQMDQASQNRYNLGLKQIESITNKAKMDNDAGMALAVKEWELRADFMKASTPEKIAILNADIANKKELARESSDLREKDSLYESLLHTAQLARDIETQGSTEMKALGGQTGTPSTSLPEPAPSAPEQPRRLTKDEMTKVYKAVDTFDTQVPLIEAALKNQTPYRNGRIPTRSDLLRAHALQKKYEKMLSSGMSQE